MKNSLCTILAALGGSPLLAAQVTLSQSFDSGALDVPGSTIDLSNPGSPGITLEPRRFLGAWPGDHWWVSFSVDGVAGTTPRFRLPTASAFQPYTDENRWVWSATPQDENSWSFFDNGFVDGNGFFRSSNNAPFVDDLVYVAYSIPYPYSRTLAHTAALVGHPLVVPTASANASLVVGTTLGTAGGGYTDDLGRSVPVLSLHGYRITDGSTLPKRKVVVTAGNHCGEPTGNWTLEGFVDFVLGSDPDAIALRELADIYVYPSADPEGRFCGYFRSNPENPTANHNSMWADPSGFTDVTIVSNAMVADTGGQADFFLDFHGFGSPTDIGYFAPTSNPLTKLTLDALHALEPTLMDLTFPNPQPGATAARWAATPSGMEATVSLTPEAGSLVSSGVPRFTLFGENHARAILSAIQDEGVVVTPKSGRVFQDRVLARAPALYLPLDENAGAVAADASGNGHAGTYVGAVDRGETSAFRRQGRRAVRFEGTAGSPGGEYVRVSDFSYAGTGDFTLAFWFKTTDIAGSGEQYLFSHGALAQPNSLNVFFQETPAVGSGNRLRTLVLDANDPAGYAGVLDISVAPADGQWHFYTLVVDGTAGATLYLDGFPARNRAGIGGGSFNPGTDLFLAARSDLDPASFYGRTGPDDGLLDEVALFDRALGDQEVLALARAPVRLYQDLRSFEVSAGGKDQALRVLDPHGHPVDAFVLVRSGRGDSAPGFTLFLPEEGLELPLPPSMDGDVVFDVLAVRGRRGRWRGGARR